MSTYIQIPNRVNQITGRNKLSLIYCYALIRSQIKDCTYKASITENQLAEHLETTERTIRNYIHYLKNDTDLFTAVDKKKGESEYKYNVYQLDYLSDEYFMLNPSFLYIPDLSADMKGLLLLLKTFCVKGTNYLTYRTQTELAETLHIGKNNIKRYLEELERKEYITIIDNTIHLSLEYFLLSVDQNTHNKIYEVIYKFCLEHKVTPPYKDSGALDLQAIETVYDVPETLYQELTKRCSKVPKTVSMNYFRQMLINNKALQQKKEYNIILN